MKKNNKVILKYLALYWLELDLLFIIFIYRWFNLFIDRSNKVYSLVYIHLSIDLSCVITIYLSFSVSIHISLSLSQPIKWKTVSSRQLTCRYRSIGLHINADKTEYMCYNQTGDISTLDGTSLKLVDKFTDLGSSVSLTEKDIDTRLTKAWTAIDSLSIIWRSDLIDKMSHSFFQSAVVSILLYGCTTWTLTKRPEKKLDGNYTRMLRAILNKSWRQHPTRH